MSNYNFELIKNVDTPIMCIFGCLLTQAGKEIKKEMLKWITTKYDCICVNQEPPGTLFEFPALKFAQKYSIDNNIPILYLHTKGAGHPKNVYDQKLCRKMWEDEFINHYDDYLTLLNANKDSVICPYTNKDGATWINGFIATPEAFSKINLYSSKNRYIYEHIFNIKYKLTKEKINVIGRILNDVDKPEKVLPKIIETYSQ